MIEIMLWLWLAGTFISFVLWCGHAIYHGTEALGIVIGLPICALWPLTTPIGLVALWLDARNEPRRTARP